MMKMKGSNIKSNIEKHFISYWWNNQEIYDGFVVIGDKFLFVAG